MVEPKKFFELLANIQLCHIISTCYQDYDVNYIDNLIEI